MSCGGFCGTKISGSSRRRIHIGFKFFLIFCGSYCTKHTILNSCFVMMGFVMQMWLLPSVQPFHAIGYTIDVMLALEIR